MKCFALACIAAAALVGCSDSTEVTTESLAGTWTAAEYEYTGSGSAEQVDLIADSAMVVTLEFNIDQSGQMTFVNGGSGSSNSFDWALDGSHVVLYGDTLQANLSGDALTLTLEGETGHDFDGDGFDESANLHAVLTRAE